MPMLQFASMNTLPTNFFSSAQRCQLPNSNISRTQDWRNMAIKLTANAISVILEGKQPERPPVLQMVELKQIMGNGDRNRNCERFRSVLWDGVQAQDAMLALQLNHLVTSGCIHSGSIVRLSEYVLNNIRNRNIIVILNMEVLMSKSEVVGEYKLYKTSHSNCQEHQKAHVPQDTTSLCKVTPHGHVVESIGERIHPTSSVNRGQGGDSNSYKKNFHVGAVNMYCGSAVSAEPPPRYSNRGPISKNEAPARIVPVAALNPYQGRWTIKARVTAKGELRRFNHVQRDGKVFSFDLLDSQGGEIRVTCFNAAADRFYNSIQQGNIYIISKGNLKPAQKNYNHLKNDWEIHLDSSSAIELCPENDNSIPKQQFSFKFISEVENMENNSMVDIIGVVTSVSQTAVILRKNGMETQKRSIQLKDLSGWSVELTIWGSFCNNEGQKLQELFDSGNCTILAIKAGRINDFSGKAIGTISSTQLFINPELPEAESLRAWFEREGRNIVSQCITKDAASSSKAYIRITISQIKDEAFGKSEKADWISVRCTISFIRIDNFCYTACPLLRGDKQCNRKATMYEGNWYCESCCQSFPECNYRYLLQLQVQDHTGLTWVTAFQEAGEEIMGITAKELYKVKYEEQDELKFAQIIRNIAFNQYLLKLKVKEERYNDEQRLKCTVIKAEKLDYAGECETLLDLIKKLSC